MRGAMKSLVRFVLFFILVSLFCEYVIYFIVLSQCSWPEVKRGMENDKIIHAMILADTHLLGIRKGHWIDKVRREWQMYRTFQAAISLHNSDVVFILGDLLDEGSFSPDAIHKVYVETFFSIFKVPDSTKLYVVPGNHDIGFHYAMSPYLDYRFGKSLNTTSVQLITIKDVHFVLVNSMAMENDGCYLCKVAEDKVEYISARLRCTNGTSVCNRRNMKLGKYSHPVLMQHFPLYRRNDEHCNEIDEAPYREKYKIFKEGWDCLYKKSTDFLLNKLKPRVVFSGHTHHGCMTSHAGGVLEYSISSFNWRNKNNPSFIMATFTAEDYAVYKCFLPRETTVIGIYVVSIIIIGIYIFYRKRFLRYKLKNHKRTL